MQHLNNIFSKFHLGRKYLIRKKIGEQVKILLQSSNPRNFLIEKNKKYYYLNEATVDTDFDRHYVYHPAWASRKLKENDIGNHVDISSTLHFCSIISAFIKVNFFDYRPANLKLSNLTCDSQDLTKLTFESSSIHSLSCMHTIEHVGLGRYGDPIDYYGDIKAIDELCRVLSVNGILLIVVPVGKQNKICFNAHRIYEPNQFSEEFIKRGLELKEFTLIPERPEDGHLVENPDASLMDKQEYACGCFMFTKKKNNFQRS